MRNLTLSAPGFAGRPTKGGNRGENLAWFHLVLASIFCLALVALPIVGLVHVGGFGALGERLTEIDPDLMQWRRGWLALIGGLGIGLGSFGNPPILVRAMSIADPEQLPRAAVIGIVAPREVRRINTHLGPATLFSHLGLVAIEFAAQVADPG